MRSLRFGSPGFVVKVEARRIPQDEQLYACSLRSEGETRITGLVAAKAAEGSSLGKSRLAFSTWNKSTTLWISSATCQITGSTSKKSALQGEPDHPHVYSLRTQIE
jgi:hypothetical protein